jgi:phage shock protein PspC (stress-responsive transcriptional regulator)
MKRLYRSRKEKMRGSVCGGLSEHIDVDPTIIRLVRAVVTVLSAGMGVLIRLIAWIVIPESPDDTPKQTTITDG